MGYVSRGRWVNEREERVDELAINPEYLFGSQLEELCQTMIHEQCHIWQYHFGKPSRKSYHDREWANKMESLGVIPSSTGMPGGSKTGQKMDDYLLAGGPAHLAIEALKKTGFDVPWIDRLPARYHIQPPKIFDRFGNRVATPNLKILGVKTPKPSPALTVANDVTELRPPIIGIVRLEAVTTQPMGEKPVAEDILEEQGAIIALNAALQPESQAELSSNNLGIFQVQLAAKAPPTRSKYKCLCVKPNLIWGRPGLKIRCEECQSSFTITV